MKVTYNWLKDFVDIKISAEELAQRLTLAGLEVTSLEKKEDEQIFELEITPNRSDCLSVIGIAQEIAAITNSKLKIKKKKLKIIKKAPLKIKIEDRKDCPLYTVRLIKNVKVKPSPEWLVKRLESVGIRAVNNIVDITNYILLETGQPLHAFDYDKLNPVRNNSPKANAAPSVRISNGVKDNRIIVRRAKRGEKIITIDGIERELNEEILVIADSQRPIALAGIMGSKDTEVTENTKNILLESAEFNPLIIRRVTRSLGLQTESSYRFERGVTKSNVIFASQRASELIKEITEGDLGIFKIEGKFKEKSKSISLEIKNVERNLGKNIPISKVKRILKSLSFRVKEEKDNLRIYIPSFRKDIKEEVDLIEEIVRIFGYENIDSTLPFIKVSNLKESIQDKIVKIIKSSLLKMGLNEVITYSLISPDFLKGEEAIGIVNPLSKDFSVLRPNLLFSLLKVLDYNINREANSVNIFELAKVYSYKNNLPKEDNVLGIMVAGNYYSDWLRNQRFNFSFFDLKGIIEIILRDLGIEDYQFKKSQISYLKEQVCFGLKDKEFGFLGEVNKNILANFKIKTKFDVYFSQIYLEILESFVHLEKKVKPIPVFPSIRRDISLIVKRNIPFEEILKIIYQSGGKLLSSVTLFDQYKGESIPEDSVSLAFSLEYRSKEKTLTTEEVDSLHKAILEDLKRNLDVKIR